MTEYLLCVLIVTVAYLIDVVTQVASSPESERQRGGREPVGIIVFFMLLLGGILYGLLKLIGWLIAKYGGGLF